MLFNHLKDNKKIAYFEALPSETPPGGSVPDTRLQLQLLYNHVFPYKTQSSSTKCTLVKVLG